MSCLHVPPAEKETPIVPVRPRFPFSFALLPALLKAALAAAFLLPHADATLILWGSKGYVENTDSKGRSWDASYSMEAGFFRNGFIPTFENRGSWAENWSRLGTAMFDAEESRFAGVIDSSATTVPSGTKIYFWAKNGDDLTKGPEWVLLTQSTWTWPGSTSPVAPALVWTTGETSISLVVGRTETAGSHLVSRSLRPVPVAEAAWLAKHFPESQTAVAGSDDPDGDGLSNTLEYFLGTDPSNGSSAGRPGIIPGGSGTVLHLARNPYAESGYDLEASTDLKKWIRVDHELLTDRPDLLEAHVPKDPAKPTWFFRFQLKPAVGE
ncbi:MAG TPA: thrombospondin type 3 repeat-containing protein [Luteolibacter sp.]|nr:thrombospondin type 3 repeat-containing protein [Luteolibacter sp.]